MAEGQQEVWRQKVALFRRKFGCREDLFGTKYYYNIPVKDAAGTTTWERKGIFHPNCSNYGNQSLCLIAQRKGSCSDCSNKVYGTLTDEWLYRHIKGRDELVLYLLQEGGIRFGAVDFDELNPFKDAVLVRDYLAKLGVASYIARSTKKGYHVYTFFSATVPAHLYTSLIRKCFLDLGIYQRAQESGKFYIPEVFPKQVSFSPDSLGNGIKPPMIESRFDEGFNCWVRDDASPVPADQQWQFLQDTADVTPEQLDAVIKTWEVEVIEAPVRRSKSAAAREVSGKRPQGTEKWEASTTGDFNKVVTKCAAMRQFWEIDADGRYTFEAKANEHGVPHMARVASLALAIRTKNGIEILQQRWGSARTEKEIEYAVRTQQRPWSCAAMQAQGLCRVGTHPQHNDHCFQKKPPMERVNGVWIPQKDLPESEWPDPSPIRFGNEGDTKRSPEEILEELGKIFTSADPEQTKHDKIATLIKAKASFSVSDQKRIDTYITKNKGLTKTELNEFNKAARLELGKEKVVEVREQYPSFTKNAKTYVMKEGKYVVITIDSKGMAHEKDLTNFVVDLNNEIAKIDSVENLEESDGKGIKERIVDGYIHVAGIRHYFRTRYETWFNKADSFAELLLREGGIDVEFNRIDFDDIKLCIQHFGTLNTSRKKRLSELGHVFYKNQDMYFMPSTIVAKDGLRSTQDFDVRFDDEYGSQYDFTILTDEQFKELAKHVLSDYFNCNSRIAAMTCFAHAMAAGIMNLLPLERNPILWLMGNQGSGKSFIAQMTQCFYGNFKTYISVSSTDKGKLYRASLLKDVLYLIDDYKKKLIPDVRGFMQFLQQSYDRTTRDRASKDGNLLSGLRCKGLLLITGEEPTEDEASTIARMLVVNCESRQDTVLGGRVMDMKHLYCGFTPQFIHYAYNLELSWIKQVFGEYTELFNIDVKEEYENTLRISQNLAHNMTAFRFVMDMLVVKGVLDNMVKDALLREHIHNLKVIRATVLNHVRSQKGSEIFLSALRDLLSDWKHFYIEGLPEDDARLDDRRQAKPLGFYRDTDPDYIYVFPHQCHSEVSELLRKSSNYTQSKSKLGRELYQDGHIGAQQYDLSGSLFTKQVTGPDKRRHHVWVIRRESLGFDSRLKVIDNKAAPTPPRRSDDDDLADLLGGNVL